MKTSLVSSAAGTGSPPRLLRPNSPQRILVVENDDDIRRLNTEVLIHHGYQAEAVENGSVAWDALQVSTYDLLVTDNNMPKVSGVELLDMLHDARMTLPTIMATGTLPRWEFTRHPWLQPDAVLLKPYTVDQLLAAVTSVLRATTHPADPN